MIFPTFFTSLVIKRSAPGKMGDPGSRYVADRWTETPGRFFLSETLRREGVAPMNERR